MPKFSANLSMLFSDKYFSEKFELVKNIGFKGVEILFPYAYKKELIKKKLQDFQLELVLFNMPPGDWSNGERGLACLPTKVDEFRDSVQKSIEYAKFFKCKNIHCMAGIRPESFSPKKVFKTFLENLDYATNQFQKNNLNVLIEPLNTFDNPNYFLNNTTQALEIINTLRKKNLKLQFDCYHIQKMEGNITFKLEKYLSIIRHIQIANVPSRTNPTIGEINYNFIFEYLDKIGYKGWVGCEYESNSFKKNEFRWIKKYL